MTLARLVLPAFPDWDFLVAAFGGGLLLTDVRIAAVAARVAPDDFALLSAPVAMQRARPDGGADHYRAAHVARLTAFWAARCARGGLIAVPTLPLQVAVAEAVAEADAPGTEPWADWTRPLLRHASAVVVPPILTWRESAWVWAEATGALRMGKPVFCLSAAELVEPLA